MAIMENNKLILDESGKIVLNLELSNYIEELKLKLYEPNFALELL